MKAHHFSAFALRAATAIVVMLDAVGILASSAQAQNNPIPFVNQPTVPENAVPGGTGFTLTVNGTSFMSGSVVTWNGSARATTFVSSSALTAVILASDIAQPRTQGIAVYNPPPGGGVSNTVLFEVTRPTSAIALSRTDFSVGTNPTSVAVGDFNGDGKQDLAVVNANCASIPCLPGSVSILLGNGNGTFAPQVTYATGMQPQAVIVADFNGDGKPDLAVANFGDNTVSILLGNGDGTFQAAVAFPTGVEPQSLIAADFNGDGKLDLAVANQFSDTVSILLGNGDGTFQSNVDYSTGAAPTSVAAGDFNGDDKLDLAVANFEDGTVSILLGNGDGTFQTPPVNYGIFVNPRSVATADVNGDGKLDLMVADLSSNEVFVLLGNGDGTFQTQQGFGTGEAPEAVILGDLSGDGNLDLILATDTNLGSASVLLGNGNGTFQTDMDFSTGLLPLSVALADFNSDGRLDLATANFSANTVSVLLNTLLQFSPDTLNFGNQNLGTVSAAQPVTLTNVGSHAVSISSITASGAYSQTNNCGSSLNAVSSCTISVTFAPTTPGTLTGTVTIVARAPKNPHVVSLTGVGSGPTAVLSSTSLSFAPQLVGTVSAYQPVTITNTGNATLTISSVANSGDFQLRPGDCGSSVAAGKDCTIQIAFKPTATGMQTGTLSIVDNALGSPQTVSLTGTGIEPAVSLSSTSLTFPTQTIGTTSPSKTVRLTNTGSATLSVASITLAGAQAGDFAQTNTCGSSVAVGANCAITMTFTPTAIGLRIATVIVQDNAPESPNKISLTGTGTTVGLSAPSLSFGNQTVGTTSAPQTVTLTNVGSTTLNIPSLTIAGLDRGDFSQTNTCGRSVAAGAQCTISVTFTPTATGSRKASVSISDNGGGSPQTVRLSGTGL